MADPTHTAIGTWSGGRFMRFGEGLDDDRLIALLRPDAEIRTVMTADTYGAGDADTVAQAGPAKQALTQLEEAGIGEGALSPHEILVTGDPAPALAALRTLEHYVELSQTA